MGSTRREFVGGCSAAIAAMAGSRVGSLTFGDPGATNQHTLVVVFLRGGWDACNVIVPGDGHTDRGNYLTARPNLRVPVTTSEDPNPALALNSGTGRTIMPGLGGMGLHRRLGLAYTGNSNYTGNLWDLWQDGNLAFVPASGLKDVITRSHFDAQELIELGTNTLASTSGWLARHLHSATNLPPDAFMTGAAVGSQEPTSLLGAPGTANFGDIGQFRLDQGYWRWRPAMRTALRNLMEREGSPNHISGLGSLDAVDIIESATAGGYTPDNGATYYGSLANSLRSIAQLIKLDLGLQVATVDFGGWDSHNQQGDGQGGSFGDRLDQIRHTLYNFYLDMDGSQSSPYSDRVTIVLVSEFGRRLGENADRGTDHGHGSLIAVLGKSVNGGMYGTWPGLAGGQLLDGADLQVTTDYRRILSEILVKQMCNTDLDSVFPDYGATQYVNDGKGMGLVTGDDLQSPQIFSDGFESGSASAWG